MSSYIEIVYGNNERMFCNADCASVNLLQFIRDKCNVGFHDMDLADTNGIIQSLRKSFNSRAILQLESGSAYIPVMFIPATLPGSASRKTRTSDPNELVTRAHIVRVCLEDPVTILFPDFELQKPFSDSDKEEAETTSPTRKMSAVQGRGTRNGVRRGSKFSASGTSGNVQKSSPKRSSALAPNA